MKTFKQFIREANEQPYKFTRNDFHEGNSPFTVRKKGGIPVKFTVSNGTHTVQSQEHKEPVVVPKGHVIVNRHTIEGDKPYSMPPESFNKLHDSIDHEKGTAVQLGVEKRAIKAHRDGVFHPSWSKVPLNVKKGDILVDNGGDENDVAAIAPDTFHKTYDIPDKKN